MAANNVHGPETFEFVKAKFEALASTKVRTKAGDTSEYYDEDNFVREFEMGAYLVRQCDRHHNR